MMITIGTVVEVTHTIEKYRDKGNVRWLRTTPPKKLGVVTGRGMRYEGVVEPGCGGEEPEPPYFICKVAHPVWLIKFGLATREHPAFLSDIKEYSGEYRLPYR